MKKSISIIFFFFFISLKTLYGQLCDVNTFQSIYWNKNTHDARIRNITITSPGYIYISGFTESSINKSTDAWIMKTTLRGTPLWSKAIGTSSSETINVVKKTGDNGFIIIGSTMYGSKYDQGLIAKADSNAVPQWCVTLGASYSSLYQVIELSDGGYAAVGTLYLEFSGDNSGNVTEIHKSTNIIIKLDKNGNTLWWKSFHFANLERLNTVAELKDGALLVSGNIVNSLDGYIIKMQQENGNIIWMNGYQNASINKFGHGTELPDSSIQLSTANKIYHFTADGKTLPSKYINLRSGSEIFKDAKPEDAGHIEPDIEIFYANILPKPPVLFAVKNDSIVWAYTYKQDTQNLQSFNGAKIYNNNIYLSGVYQADKLSDANADENLSYLIKTDSSGKTFCTDSFDISMDVTQIAAAENIDHGWIYEGVLDPGPIQLYSEDLEPLRSSDCYTQTCCRDTVLHKNDFICEGSIYKLPDGSIVKDAGNYVSALNTFAGCDSVIHTNLSLKKHFDLSLGNDTCLINNMAVTFVLPGDSSVRYRWQDGSANSTYTANFPGEYWVTAGSACNTVTDSVKVYEDCAPTIFIPSAFTPNKDGLNDIFRILNMSGQHLLNFNIYNRYGQLIFATADSQKGWDGTIGSIPQPPGTYVYFIRYVDLVGKPRQLKGTVVLIR